MQSDRDSLASADQHRAQRSERRAGIDVDRAAPRAAASSGSTWDGEDVTFSLLSENAQRVELCLLDDDGGKRRNDVQDRRRA